MVNMENIIKDTSELSILYVEDDQIVREATLKIFDLLFKNMIVAVNGADGLAKFKKNKIDIVITDINMSIMNGLDMARYIKSINQSIPIFVFSAYQDTEYFMEAIKIGIEGYMIKPIEINQFFQSLSKTIENIKLKKENNEYKVSLEEKVKLQVEELQQKNKLLFQSTKMAAMGDMIDAIAHQWKQPLCIIKLQAQEIEYEIEEITINKKNIKKKH
jgi:YesN/AraC family two-component response regulator